MVVIHGMPEFLGSFAVWGFVRFLKGHEVLGYSVGLWGISEAARWGLTQFGGQSVSCRFHDY